MLFQRKYYYFWPNWTNARLAQFNRCSFIRGLWVWFHSPFPSGSPIPADCAGRPLTSISGVSPLAAMPRRPCPRCSWPWRPCSLLSGRLCPQPCCAAHFLPLPFRWDSVRAGAALPLFSWFDFFNASPLQLRWTLISSIGCEGIKVFPPLASLRPIRFFAWFLLTVDWGWVVNGECLLLICVYLSFWLV